MSKTHTRPKLIVRWRFDHKKLFCGPPAKKIPVAGTAGWTPLQFRHDQHRQKGRSFLNHATTIQRSHRMCDNKRTSQTHTRTATLCEGDKGGSGEREQITSQHNRWAPSQRGRSSWFNDQTTGGYTTFEQFRNGQYYSMPH